MGENKYVCLHASEEYVASIFSAMNLFEAGVEGTESKLCVSYRVSGMEFGRLNLRK